MFGQWTKNEDTPFWKQRSWLLAAGFLAVTIIMSLVALLTGGGDNGTLGAAAVPAKAMGPGGRPNGCSTDDSDNAKPDTPPPDLQWREIDGTRAPTSPSAGPRLSDGPVLWCFAHTRTGAVIAAHVIPAQMSGAGWRMAVEQQVMPGYGRDMFVSQRASIPDTRPPGQQAGRYTGFLLSGYSRDEAKVALLVSNAQGAMSTTSVSLRWSGGDWKVEPDPGGGLHSPVTSVGSSAGFVKWGD